MSPVSPRSTSSVRQYSMDRSRIVSSSQSKPGKSTRRRSESPENESVSTKHDSIFPYDATPAETRKSKSNKNSEFVSESQNLKHFSHTIRHDSASVLQNSILKDTPPYQNRDSNLKELRPSAVRKDLSSNRTITISSKNCDASDDKQGSLSNKIVICDSDTSKESCLPVVTSECIQLSKYQCPLCSFNCDEAKGFTNHLEDAHAVLGLKPKLSEGSTTKSSDLNHSKDTGPGLSDETSQSSVNRSQFKDSASAVSSNEAFLQSSVDTPPSQTDMASEKTGEKGYFSSSLENRDSSAGSSTKTRAPHERTPPVMESSSIAENEQDEQLPAENEVDEQLPDDPESGSQQVVVNCPICRVVLFRDQIEQHLALHIPQYSCHLCTFSCQEPEAFSTHFALTHQIDQHLKPGMVGIVNHPIRILFRESNNVLTTTRFNKMKKEEKLKEIETPGNGFCFVSSLIIGLAEAGVNKSFEYLIKEIMNEVEMHSKAYRWSEKEATTPINQSDEETVLKACEDFLQGGDYANEYADICVGSAANALGINLNIFHKNADNKFVLYTHDCLRYASRVNIFLIYYKNNTKNLDAHYNCFVKQDYYQKNKAAIKSRMICGTSFNESQQMRDDMLLAQRLSREYGSEQNFTRSAAASASAKGQQKER